MAAHSRCGAGGVVGVHMCACFFSLHSLVEMHTMNTILGLHDLNEFRRVDRGTHCLDRLFVCLSLP